MGTYSRGFGYQFHIGDYFPRAIKTICIACVSVFAVQEISRLIYPGSGWGFWLAWFGLTPVSLTHGFIWQPFTYLFLHGGISHIFFNLLYLAMFGADLERTWGSRKFYRYYFLCGVGAGLIDVAVREALVAGKFAGAHNLFDPTIGASGAIYGVLLAVAMVMPHRRVWFFPIPVTMPMWLLVTILGALEFFPTTWRFRRRNQPRRMPSGRDAGWLSLLAPRILSLFAAKFLVRLEAAADAQEIRSLRPRPSR